MREAFARPTVQGLVPRPTVRLRRAFDPPTDSVRAEAGAAANQSAPAQMAAEGDRRVRDVASDPLSDGKCSDRPTFPSGIVPTSGSRVFTRYPEEGIPMQHSQNRATRPRTDTSPSRLAGGRRCSAVWPSSAWRSAEPALGAAGAAPTMQVLPSPTGVKYSQTVEVKAQNLPKGSGIDRADDLRVEQRRRDRRSRRPTADDCAGANDLSSGLVKLAAVEGRHVRPAVHAAEERSEVRQEPALL